VLLAQTLLERKHGSRPVTLIGFSMGARLIYSCLHELERVHSVFLKEAAETASKEAAEATDDSPIAGKDSPVAG
jgi:surfactin synthase thioesterase subunit